MPTLAGRLWTAATDLIGTDGRAYSLPKSPDAAGTPAFPDGIFNDFLTELEVVKVPGAISATSVLIGTGAKAFTLAASSTLRAGSYRVYSAASPGNAMYGTLAADLAGTALNLTILFVTGSGTFADWIITRVDATLRQAISAKAATYNVVAADLGALIHATIGTWDLTLAPAATLGTGFWFEIHNAGAGVITINPSGAETINGGATLAIAAGKSAKVTGNGALWLARVGA